MGAIVEENPSWQAFTGQSLAEYKGWGWLHAVHRDDREQTDRLWAESLREKQSYINEYRLRRYDGQYRYVVARGAPVLDSEGAAREWIGSCVDVTDRKQKEAELAESERRYRLVADAANDAIWDWEIAPDQISWNEGVRTNFGYSLREVQSDMQWWRERIHPDDVQHVVREMQMHLESDSDAWQAEYRFRRADGSYAYVFDRGRIVRNAERRPLRMVCKPCWRDFERPSQTAKLQGHHTASLADAPSLAGPQSRWHPIHAVVCVMIRRPRLFSR